MSKSWFGYLALNLILVFFSGSCNSQITGSPTATYVVTALKPTVSPTPTFPPTQVPTPIPSRPPEPTPDPSAFLFNSFRMVSEAIGWGTADLPDSQGENWSTRILRTADGGLNWLDVSPPDMSEIVDTFFLDENNAWVVTTIEETDSASGPAVLVWYTRNGGHTWNKGGPLAHRGMGMSAGSSVFFSDAQHGWLMNGDDVAMGSESVTLYKTEDGGSNWKEILSTSLANEPPLDAIPLACYKSFLVFRDASTGWVTGSCLSDNVLLEITSDGGLSWRAQDLPLPDGLSFGGGLCTPYPPTFFSPQEGILQVICETISLSIYHTYDGGQTWEGPAYRSRMMTTSLVDFVDSNNGWHFASEDVPTNTKGVGFYVTHDGGKTWSEITPIINVSDAYDLPPNKLEAIRDFDFIDVEVGWATLDVGDYSLMLKTNDGGFTWSSWVPLWQNAHPRN